MSRDSLPTLPSQSSSRTPSFDIAHSAVRILSAVRTVLEVFLVLAAISQIATGVWLLARPRLPSWVKGSWAWPLGENRTAALARLIGWAYLLTGATCLPAVVVVAMWDRSPTTVIAIIGTAFLAGAATFALSWAVAESHRKPARQI